MDAEASAQLTVERCELTRSGLGHYGVVRPGRGSIELHVAYENTAGLAAAIHPAANANSGGLRPSSGLPLKPPTLLVLKGSSLKEAPRGAAPITVTMPRALLSVLGGGRKPNSPPGGVTAWLAPDNDFGAAADIFTLKAKEDEDDMDDNYDDDDDDDEY